MHLPALYIYAAFAAPTHASCILPALCVYTPFSCTCLCLRYSNLCIYTSPLPTCSCLLHPTCPQFPHCLRLHLHMPPSSRLLSTSTLPHSVHTSLYCPSCRWDLFYQALATRFHHGSQLPPSRSSALSRPNITFSHTLPSGRNFDQRQKHMHLAMHGLAGNQSLYVDFCYAGNMPSWRGAGIKALNATFAMKGEPPPDIVVFNMAAWAGKKMTDVKLYGYMGEIFKHARMLAASRGSNTTFIWRDGMVDKWSKRNRHVGDLARAQQWQVLDTMPLFTAMTKQRLWLQMRRTDGEDRAGRKVWGR